MKIFTHHH